MDQVSRRRRSLSVCLGIVLGLLPLLSNAADQDLEYQVKAAFLLNFTKFIEWPETSESSIDICILGDDPFGTVLDRMVADEVVNGHKVTVLRTRRTPVPKSCEVLFIRRSEKENAKFLPELGPGILTVGEGEEFLRGGGMIAFVLENSRVRFDINEAVARNAGLKISSKLLNVARTVKR
jgi:hypothetical protein